MRFNISAKLYAGFGAAVVILLLISAVSFNGVQNLVANSGDVAHTHEVLDGLDAIIGDLKDAETGQRGFLITGAERYLEPYTAGLSSLQGHIDTVASLTSDNPKQQARIAEMQPWVDEKLAELDDTINLRRDEGFEAARTVVLTDAGKESADQIRVLISAMIEEEASLLVVRADATASAASTVKNIILIGSVIALVVVAGVAFYLSRAIAGGIAKVSSGMQKIAVGELDEQVSITSNDELGDMSTAYSEMQEYLSQTAAVASAIADGDLTIESKPKSDKDVLGTAFSTMLVKLRGVIGGALDSANTLATAKDQLATTADQAGKATQEIARTVGQVAEGTSRSPAASRKSTPASLSWAMRSHGSPRGLRSRRRPWARRPRLAGKSRTRQSRWPPTQARPRTAFAPSRSRPKVAPRRCRRRSTAWSVSSGRSSKRHARSQRWATAPLKSATSWA